MTAAAGATVLVTGASGFVGQALLPRLTAADWRVIAGLRRLPDVTLPGAAECRVIGDLSDPAFDPALALAGVSAVVHLAGLAHRPSGNDAALWQRVNADATTTLARACRRAGVRRFIFVSTARVLGRSSPTDRMLTDQSPVHPADAYAASKAAAEAGLRALGDQGPTELVILRPPLVYGPGVRANMARLVAAVDRRWPLPFATLENRLSMIGLTNLTDAISRALIAPDAAGATLLVSDLEPVSTAQLVRAIGRALDQRPRLWPCPHGLLRLAGFVTGQAETMARLTDSFHLDGSPAQQVLGWSPACTLEQELNALAAWWRATKP